MGITYEELLKQQQIDLETVSKIKNHPIYKQIMADNCGGLIYDIANRNKYDTLEILTLWNSLSEARRESCDGIIKGAMSFIQGN